ncbi:DoxX family protein [Brevibacillus composti]|uniref:DoxX family protein n=1 Tax=Brevibacillus composti TaxID=2796470 RepID=A0A7T5EJ99_9BACL|nr:DoxX family protein [Brevibacillus composti]QQE73672.1 DoxX family protein [Brevibacillus composti]QUO40755.1 DoxX family protein [Brevibacillus composti]
MSRHKGSGEAGAAGVLTWRGQLEQAAYTLLRIVTGLVFWAHGLAKWKQGMGSVTEWFGSVGLPEWLAYPVIAIELAGGMALILGVATRYAAGALAVIMAGAILTVKWQNGLIGEAGKKGYELDLLLMAITLYVAAKGRGGRT